jgi:hypothetical protein
MTRPSSAVSRSVPRWAVVASDPDAAAVCGRCDVTTSPERQDARSAAAHRIDLVRLDDDRRRSATDGDDRQDLAGDNRDVGDRRPPAGVDVEHERRVVCDHEPEARRMTERDACQRDRPARARRRLAGRTIGQDDRDQSNRSNDCAWSVANHRGAEVT